MTLSDFKKTLAEDEVPKDLHVLLQALWYDAKGQWGKAHELAQDIETKNGAWVHAYLHNKEGDISNASYWYQKAGKKIPNQTLEKEWEDIVDTFLREL